MDGFRPRFFELLTDDIGEKGDMADDKGLRCEFKKENFYERSRGVKERKGCGLWLLISGIEEDKSGKHLGTGKTSVIFLR